MQEAPERIDFERIDWDALRKGPFRTFRLGIDPGSRFVAVSVVGITADDLAVPLYLLVVDLGSGKNHLRLRLAGRAVTRRARRTRKSKRARLREIRTLLQAAGLPALDVARVLALCRRRGWNPDMGGDEEEKSDPASIRVEREVVLAALERLLADRVPSARPHVADILHILRQPAKANGNDNRLVGVCSVAGCRRKRADGLAWPLLWLAASVLPNLQGDDWAAARSAFLATLSGKRCGIPRTAGGTALASLRGNAANVLGVVGEAWSAAAKAQRGMNPASLNRRAAQVARVLGDVAERIKTGSGPRLRMCPEHLLAHVQALAQGLAADVEQEAGNGRKRRRLARSLLWNTVAAKIESFLAKRLRATLPKGARIEVIVAERAAFDLGETQGPLANMIRWLGPYGQLAMLLPPNQRGSAPIKTLLAAETGGLCAVCGRALDGQVHIGHLVPTIGTQPYLGITAMHPGCNEGDGKFPSRIAAEAVAAMKRVRERLERDMARLIDRAKRGPKGRKTRAQGLLHPWFYQKYGLLNLMAQSNLSDRAAAATITRIAEEAMVRAAATMQQRTVIAEAIQRAVAKAGLGNPAISARAATEVVAARLQAVGTATASAATFAPWFNKDLDKDKGSVVNHGMDAFLAAALPPAQPRMLRDGRQIWRMDPQALARRTAAIRTEADWRAASGPAWDSLVEQAVPVDALTLRRVWRQAFARETRMREVARGGKTVRVYRKPAQAWLDDAEAKANDPKKLEAHAAGLVLPALRKVAAEAVAGSATYQALRDAVIPWLQRSVLDGLRTAAQAPAAGHPAREARVKALEAWARNLAATQPDVAVPPWISLMVIDRASGGGAPRVMVSASRADGKTAVQNVESWALEQWVVASRRDGAWVWWRVELDGSLSPLSKEESAVRPGAWRARALPSPELPAGDPKWRQAIGSALREAGCARAWLVGRGSHVADFWLRPNGRALADELRDWLRSRQLRGPLRVSGGVRLL